MKYYVTRTEYRDGNIYREIMGNYMPKTRDIRRCAFFINQEMPEDRTAIYTEKQIIENLYNSPMTKVQAKRYFNLVKKGESSNIIFGIKEYPETVSLSQFDAFIRW